MNIRVNPYSNYSKPNSVSFQAELCYKNIDDKYYSEIREKTAEHFKILTSDSPDDIFVVSRPRKSDSLSFDFWITYKDSKSSSYGRMPLFPRDEFLRWDAKKRAEFLVKLYRIKKCFDETQAYEDSFLREKINSPLHVSFI